MYTVHHHARGDAAPRMTPEERAGWDATYRTIGRGTATILRDLLTEYGDWGHVPAAARGPYAHDDAAAITAELARLDAMAAGVTLAEDDADAMRLTGGHDPGYDAQQHGPHGHWLPGMGRLRGLIGGRGGGKGDTARAARAASAQRKAERAASRLAAAARAQGHAQADAEHTTAVRARGGHAADPRVAVQRAWERAIVAGQHADALGHVAEEATQRANDWATAHVGQRHPALDHEVAQANLAWRHANQEAQHAADQARQAQDDLRGVHGQSLLPARPGVSDPGSRLDEHGTEMPFTRGEFDHAMTGAATAARQGRMNMTMSATINGREYYVKHTVAERHAFTSQMADEMRTEAATVAGWKALGYGHLAPGEAYHLVGADGTHYAIIAKVPGEQSRDFSRADMAARVSSEDLQRAVLGEYVLGVVDRNSGNLMYDPVSGTIHEIDHGFALTKSAGLTPSTAEAIWREGVFRAAEEAAHPNQTMHEVVRLARRAQEFSRHVLRDTIAHEDAVTAALSRYGLDEERMGSVRDRFAFLRQLDAGREAPTYAELYALAGRNPYLAAGV